MIWLNTFGFQAPGFYAKLGYEQFGMLEKCLNGSSQHFFRKCLSPGKAEVYVPGMDSPASLNVG
ncbi:MAG: hypothetical protein VB144_13075 [Clostridia bacterium]|nr:hypothetical protein [Clostridia bacterium]